MCRLLLLFFMCCLSPCFAANFVIESLVTDEENNFWGTRNKMHMTLGHIKNVDEEKLQSFLASFNEENAALLQANLMPGFCVERFNTNGFGNGYHILEADAETTVRCEAINQKLYDALLEYDFGALSDKTTPKKLNPKGYTPHIEFLETNKISAKGDRVHFKDWKLIGRKQT